MRFTVTTDATNITKREIITYAENINVPLYLLPSRDTEYRKRVGFDNPYQYLGGDIYYFLLQDDREGSFAGAQTHTDSAKGVQRYYDSGAPPLDVLEIGSTDRMKKNNFPLSVILEVTETERFFKRDVVAGTLKIT